AWRLPRAQPLALEADGSLRRARMRSHWRAAAGHHRLNYERGRYELLAERFARPSAGLLRQRHQNYSIGVVSTGVHGCAAYRDRRELRAMAISPPLTTN